MCLGCRREHLQKHVAHPRPPPKVPNKHFTPLVRADHDRESLLGGSAMCPSEVKGEEGPILRPPEKGAGPYAKLNPCLRPPLLLGAAVPTHLTGHSTTSNFTGSERGAPKTLFSDDGACFFLKGSLVNGNRSLAAGRQPTMTGASADALFKFHEGLETFKTRWSGGKSVSPPTHTSNKFSNDLKSEQKSYSSCPYISLIKFPAPLKMPYRADHGKSSCFRRTIVCCRNKVMPFL